MNKNLVDVSSVAIFLAAAGFSLRLSKKTQAKACSYQENYHQENSYQESSCYV